MGCIPLLGSTVKMTSVKRNLKNAFKLISPLINKTYYIQTESQSELIEWIQAIVAASKSVKQFNSYFPLFNKKQPNEKKGFSPAKDSQFQRSVSKSIIIQENDNDDNFDIGIQQLRNLIPYSESDKNLFSEKKEIAQG